MIRVLFGLLCAVTWIAPLAVADDFRTAHGDFFHVLFTDKEEIRGRYLFEKDHGEEHGSAEFDLNAFSIDGEVPIPVSEDLYVRVGAGYGARVYDFDSARGARSALGSETLHRAEAVSGLGYFFSEDFLVTGIARVGVFSDFDSGLDEDDLQVHGEVLGVFRFNPGSQVVFGVRESNDFEDESVLPLIGFRMLSDDGKLHLSLTVPVEARLGYNLSPDVLIYAQAAASGEEYQMDTGRVDDRFDLRVHDRRYGIGTDVRLGDVVTLKVEGGLAIGSELEFETDDAGQFDGDLDEAGYVIAGIGLTL